jgi:predicted DNA-binding protein (UPF0251 family)
VVLDFDEFEAIRLIYLEGLDQNRAAKQMRIHRSTVSRILRAANRKIADALVNLKVIKIEGAGCKIKEVKGG